MSTEHFNAVQESSDNSNKDASNTRSAATLCCVKVWEQIRRPFPLTKAMKAFHKCQWEHIEVDVLGCLLCGNIHVCSIESCDCIEIADGMVCVLSGVCVKTKNFKQDEYCDRVMPYCFCENVNKPKRSIGMDKIESCLHELLCSPATKRAYYITTQREINKISTRYVKYVESMQVVQCVQNNCDRKANTDANREANTDANREANTDANREDNKKHFKHTSTKTCNVIEILENVMALGKKTRILCGFNEKLRIQCIDHIKHKILTILNFYQMHCNKGIKPMEIRTYVFGLVYLMRSGIVVNNIQVIAQSSVLNCILPTENLLESHLNFRSKCITDIENRIKFFFRQIHPSLLASLVT